MVSTPEEVTDVSPVLRINQTIVKKPSARKSLCLFTNVFDVKNITNSVVLNLQNHNSESLNLEIDCGLIKKTKKGIKKPTIKLDVICTHG